jgi:DNA polymerase-4
MKFRLPFNPAPSTILYIDLNSAFASIEQLCDPFLRGKPIAVAAYISPRGCILSPSIEAKELGIKTGMLVREGKQLCPELVVLQTDPPKYRAVHLQMKKLLAHYTDKVEPKSIDEFALDMKGIALGQEGLWGLAKEIKARMEDEIGKALRASIGLAPNRYLAKTAAGLHKPDGLEEINSRNYAEVFSQLELMDLCGIKNKNCVRLNSQGIRTATDFYNARVELLQAAFESIAGYYWYMRLHGWEIDATLHKRKSYGNSHALAIKPRTPNDLAPVLMKLGEKTGYRMRRAGYECRGVHVAFAYRDGSSWRRDVTLKEPLFNSLDIFKVAFDLMCQSPYRKPITHIMESVFNLSQSREALQLSLFGDLEKKHHLVEALDSIKMKFGDFAITPAIMLSAQDMVPDRIGFGNARELERERLNGILAKHTTQPIDRIIQDTDRNYYMDPPNAVEYGIVDEVLTNPVKAGEKLLEKKAA